MRHCLIGGVIVAMLLAACALSVPTAMPSSPAASGPSADANGSPSPGALGTFEIAGLTSVLDVPGPIIATSMFTTTFASETPAIYVKYRLSPGSSGRVVSTWRNDDVEINTFSFEYPVDAPWAYFQLSYQDGFVPGDYEEELKLLDSGNTVTLPFTITGPRKAPSAPTPVPSGTSAFTLLSMATFADPTQPGPDSAFFTAVFKPDAPRIYVVFALRPDLSGKVVCTMTLDGSDYIKPLTIDYGTENSWGDFEITPSGALPIGDYVATLTYVPSGEVISVPFKVK